MLKLYIALNDPKRYTEELSIKIAGNKPIKIENYECWFENMLKSYLDDYLGISNTKEAERELNMVYGKKVGNKGNPQSSLYIYGIYQLLINTKIQSDSRNGASPDCCKFILGYLMIVGLIDVPNFKTFTTKEIDKWVQQNQRIIRSKINRYIKENITLNDILNSREYKLSPNNTNKKNFW